MVLVPGKVILDAAERGKFGVPALNINEMLQLQAYLNAGFELKSPLILQASMGSREFTGWLSHKKANPDLGARVTIDMINTFSNAYAAEYGYDIPIAVILDHGPDFKQCKGAIDNGFTMVMIDGSLDYSVKKEGKHPPRSLEENIRLTKEVVDYAHERGVSVEGELGTLGGIEDKTAATQVLLTEPKEVRPFVEQTRTDALAVAIGTSHGAYKFKSVPELALELVEQIYREAGDTRLVMHGASSVPEDLVSAINHYPILFKGQNKLSLSGVFRTISGDKVLTQEEERVYSLDNVNSILEFARDLESYSCMKKSMGVPMEQIQTAIRLGIRKINVDTDGRIATTGAIKKYLADNPGVFDQRKYFEQARNALYEMAISKIKGFGSEGHAKNVEILTLEQMAKEYKSR